MVAHRRVKVYQEGKLRLQAKRMLGTIQHFKEGRAVWWRSFFPAVTPLRESPRRQLHGSTLMSQRGRHTDMRVTTESTFAQQGWENNGMGMAQSGIRSPERVFHLKWGVKVLGAFHYQIIDLEEHTGVSRGVSSHRSAQPGWEQQF